MIGESHAERSSKFYALALKSLKEKKPTLDCVLVEMPEAQYQKALDACNDRKDCNKSKLPDFSGVKEGLALGLKVFAIDAVPDEHAPSFLTDVSHRNQVMASNTEKLLKEGKCHSVVVVMGSAHGHHDERFKSIPELLEQKKIPSYRIALVSPALNTFGETDDDWVWRDQNKKSVCKKVPGLINHNFGMMMDKSAEKIPAYYGPFTDPRGDARELAGSWGDYQAVMAIGCDDPTVIKCTTEDKKSYDLKNESYLHN